MGDTSSVLEIILRAKDEATSKLKTMASQAKNLSVGFVAVGGAITGALTLAVKAAAGAEVEMAKMNATLTAMGRNTPAVKDAILKAADATLKLGFDNEEAALSITRLFQRTGDLTKATKLNALAMDLSRAKNISLEQASTLVGQVLAGNGKILKQYGIDIKETASPMEALAELQGRVAGQAEEYSKTLQGQMDVFKQSFGELMETVGTVLLPVLTQFVQKISEIMMKIKEWTDAHPELTKKIVMIVAVLGGMLTVVGAIGLALGPLAVGLAALSTPVAIVAAIIAGLILIMKNFWDITQLLSTDSKLVIEGLKLYWQDFANFLTGIFGKVKTYFSEVWTGIKIIFKENLDAIIGFFQPLFDVIEKVKKAISSVVDGVKSGVSTAVKKISGKKAMGGSVLSGGSYLVGEQGPEIFTPFQSGSITPNSRIGGGASIVVNINGGTYLSKDVARQIGDMIVSQFKMNIRI